MFNIGRYNAILLLTLLLIGCFEKVEATDYGEISRINAIIRKDIDSNRDIDESILDKIKDNLTDWDTDQLVNIEKGIIDKQLWEKPLSYVSLLTEGYNNGFHFEENRSNGRTVYKNDIGQTVKYNKK